MTLLAREVFFREMADLDFPALERFYIHPKEREDEIITENTLKKFIQNAPKLKTIQFGENLSYSDITNSFLFDIFKRSRVFVIFGQLRRQIYLEYYIMKRCHLEYAQYQMSKCDFVRFCENYGIYALNQ